MIQPREKALPDSRQNGHQAVVVHDGQFVEDAQFIYFASVIRCT